MVFSPGGRTTDSRPGKGRGNRLKTGPVRSSGATLCSKNVKWQCPRQTTSAHGWYATHDADLLSVAPCVHTRLLSTTSPQGGGVSSSTLKRKVGKRRHIQQNSNDAHSSRQGVSPPSHRWFKATLEASRHRLTPDIGLEIHGSSKHRGSSFGWYVRYSSLVSNQQG